MDAYALIRPFETAAAERNPFLACTSSCSAEIYEVLPGFIHPVWPAQSAGGELGGEKNSYTRIPFVTLMREKRATSGRDGVYSKWIFFFGGYQMWLCTLRPFLCCLWNTKMHCVCFILTCACRPRLVNNYCEPQLDVHIEICFTRRCNLNVWANEQNVPNHFPFFLIIYISIIFKATFSMTHSDTHRVSGLFPAGWAPPAQWWSSCSFHTPRHQ